VRLNDGTEHVTFLSVRIENVARIRHKAPKNTPRNKQMRERERDRGIEPTER